MTSESIVARAEQWRERLVRAAEEAGGRGDDKAAWALIALAARPRLLAKRLIGAKS